MHPCSALKTALAVKKQQRFPPICARVCLHHFFSGGGYPLAKSFTYAESPLYLIIKAGSTFFCTRKNTSSPQRAEATVRHLFAAESSLKTILIFLFFGNLYALQQHSSALCGLSMFCIKRIRFFSLHCAFCTIPSLLSFRKALNFCSFPSFMVKKTSHFSRLSGISSQDLQFFSCKIAFPRV